MSQVNPSDANGGQTVSVAIANLEDRILVQPLDAEQKTQSGLVIPTPPRRSPRRARSWQWDRVGSTKAAPARPLDVAVGDVVVY